MIKQIGLVVLVMGLLVGNTGCIGGCGTYSEGDRTGTVSKFSKRGLVWDSWEGEMVLGGVRAGENGAAVANVWKFHVPNRLAPQFTKAVESGQRVTLHYRQWVVSPIDQDSDYDVTRITVEHPAAVTPAPATTATAAP